MSLLNEAMMDAVEQQAAAANAIPSQEEIEEHDYDAHTCNRITMPDFSFLASRTGEGAIDDYMLHPLNFDNTKSTARIIRGATGICGSLDYGLVDIALGIIEKIQEKKKVVSNGQKWTYNGEQ